MSDDLAVFREAGRRLGFTDEEIDHMRIRDLLSLVVVDAEMERP